MDIDPEEDDFDAPSRSQSGQLILYGPLSVTTNLGTGAPTLMDWINKKRVKNSGHKHKASGVGDVTVALVVKANISEDITTDSGESATASDIIMSYDTTARAPSTTVDASHQFITGLVIEVSLASSPRADLGERDIAPIPPTDVISDETNAPIVVDDVPLSDHTRLPDVSVLRI
ncbi:hypothetical protein GUJ93_ZPchr0005g16063 [Zizania palustris]|uniref:Uncharacterized protein n=1 Tax=Zizania palustris TaxID=103762 RepID=A0A8J5S5T9_ZIZPA|nr:hypothetical protein GUJ93_ZPchr0005g16063 [Zizania palustris]